MNNCKHLKTQHDTDQFDQIYEWCEQCGAVLTEPLKLEVKEASNDIVDKIIAYESGELNAEESISLFQELINSGQVWGLQGHYTSTAGRLIEAGLCQDPRKAKND